DTRPARRHARAGFILRRGGTARRHRTTDGIGDRRGADTGVRTDLLAVHAAARAAPADRHQGRQNAGPSPAGERGAPGSQVIASSPTVLSGEIAVPCTGNPL